MAARYAGYMPRLLLLRHAKAERSGKGGKADHDRQLSKRGRNAAADAGRALAERRKAIDLVLCSTSQRTRETWDAVQAATGDEPEMRFLRELYEAGDTYLDILRAEGGEAPSLLLVGHNPTIQATAVALAAEPDSAAATSMATRFPTAALAILDFEGAWADLRPGAAVLAGFLTTGEDESEG